MHAARLVRCPQVSDIRQQHGTNNNMTEHHGITAHPTDQAHGLRQMFNSRVQRFVPIVSNPHLLFGGVVLERLCSAWGEMGLSTLVVDAGERSSPPRELAEFDLREGIESLSSQVHYLSARGLPLRHVDAHGSSASFIDALAQAAPGVDVVLVHASASELARMFGRAARRDGAHRLCPAVLVDERAESITHAYAGIKTLATRAGLLAHNLIVCSTGRGAGAPQIAQRLATCSDSFLGAAQRSWIEIDPLQPATEAPHPTLRACARELLDAALPYLSSDSLTLAAAGPGAALPARLAPVLN